MSLKIFAITIGTPDAASTKYRILQYEPFFKQQGWHLSCVPQKELTSKHLEEMAEADVIINQKCLLGYKWLHTIKTLKKPVIFDFDDAIYTRPGKPFSLLTRWRVQHRMKQWLQHSRAVVVANDFLKQHADKHHPAITIPMALDLNIWQPATRKHHPNQIRIGWAGAPVNLHHIERLGPLLASLIEENPNITLSIYSGRKPSLPCPFEYTAFSNGTEHSFIQTLDIGLLPLTNEEFTKGKSPLKAIQYLACGVPVVGNVFGATHEILDPTNSISVESAHEWKNALQYLISNPIVRQQLASAGHNKAQKQHNINVTSRKLLELIGQLV